MQTPPIRSATRPGTPGLDVFKIAGRSISGFVPSFKTGEGQRARVPFTTHLEERLALFLEYHPHVHSYQRGDASAAFVSAYRLAPTLETPYRISYVYDGKAHDYLPDFVGTLCDGGLLIAEAGRASEKRQGQSLAKAEAARRVAHLKGGVYWIGTEEQLSLRRHHNLLVLHAHRKGCPTSDEIVATLLKDWPWGDFRSVKECRERFGSRWSEVEVEATVWKLAADAAAAGRLLVDLTEVDLDLTTPLAFLNPTAPPILPDPLPSGLLESEQEDAAPPALDVEDREVPLEDEGVIPGPPFDGSTIVSEEHRKRFYRNLAAATEMLTGGTLPKVAEQHEMGVSTLWRLVQRVKTHGQLACVPHGTYHRERRLRPEFQQLIRKLYTQPKRPSITEVFEDVHLQHLAEELSQQEGTVVLLPTYRQVWKFIRAISQEAAVAQARSGLKHAPHERMSTHSFVLSIPAPALLCQVDEHTLDLLIVTPEGTVVTRRVHAAVLICVKTAAILGAVLALDSLKEEDYMRLVKQALEPKDRLIALYECQHRWPCVGKPAVIFHDRGKIFTSERATQVLVDRLGIVTEQAPPYAPSAKGTVEALFTWTTRKLEHRLPGTSKATPADRGTYDSAREAHKAGITFDVLEKCFIQAIVDGYMQEWDTLRRQTRLALWEAGVQEKGIPRWLGSQDDLKLLLMKAVNRKNPATGRYALHPSRGLSFLGHRYVSPGLLDRLRGKEIDIYYDRRDLSVIYLFLEGTLVGEAYCIEFGGRRVSLWEAQAEQRADRMQAARATAESLASRQRIQREATSGRRLLTLEARRLEQQRSLDHQRPEIHPSHAQAVLEALAEHQAGPSVAPPTRTGLLPPALPEDEEADTPVVHLPVRPWEDRHE
jgi:transposase